MASTPPPTCHRADCTAVALVHWQRRRTPTEIEDEHAKEQARRAEWPPDLAESEPLPNGSIYSYLVEACGPHAIDQDSASRIHQATCPGPDSSSLPRCGCEPEAHPAAHQAPEPQLPAHWGSKPEGD